MKEKNKKNGSPGKRLRKRWMAGCTVLAAALIIGGVAFWQDTMREPEFPVFTDPVMETSLEAEDTPLASSPKTTSKTTKKTKSARRKVKLKKKSKKSYTKKLPTKKKTSKKTVENDSSTVKTQTTVVTATTEKYTKNSPYKVVTTKVTTTIRTTTTTMPEAAYSAQSGNTSGSSDSGAVSTGSSTSSQAQAAEAYTADVTKLAPLMNGNVISAFQKLGFAVTVDPSVSYSGYFNAKTRSITLRSASSVVYHELGHFIAFAAGNADKSSSFLGVYNAEKSLYTGVNKAYVIQNSSEYFAESVKDYMLTGESLKASRPKTYEAVENAIKTITDEQVAKLQKVYGPFWS